MHHIVNHDISVKHSYVWEQRKLNQVAEFFDNLRVPVTASDRVAGDTPYYGANGIQDYVKGYTHDGRFTLVAEDGANDLHTYPVNFVQGKVWVNNHAHVLSGKAGVADTQFLAYRIQTTNIYPYLVGGGRAKLNGEVLKQIPVRMPSVEEQVVITQFLSKVDKAIALHQRKYFSLPPPKLHYFITYRF
ncbi:restriction endonuclease subunit S [Lacticaseibacillus nasuensis]|uniref:restriction endonuclease subunit S n=1 Tax=Lacticaseibacillus nasuensis TaxID=944671 RepID=UPI002247AF51|nr:restriction endonuclease subunit S [Lacticaseibacillus nasuensis]MCX2455025.1 restriction endonuclease subunit S [Lacticaseibacillus nasuensis]